MNIFQLIICNILSSGIHFCTLILWWTKIRLCKQWMKLQILQQVRKNSLLLFPGKTKCSSQQWETKVDNDHSHPKSDRVMSVWMHVKQYRPQYRDMDFSIFKSAIETTFPFMVSNDLLETHRASIDAHYTTIRRACFLIPDGENMFMIGTGGVQMGVRGYDNISEEVWKVNRTLNKLWTNSGLSNSRRVLVLEGAINYQLIWRCKETWMSGRKACDNIALQLSTQYQGISLSLLNMFKYR